MLDTFVTITLYDGSDPAILDAAFDICRDYRLMLDRFDPESILYRLNHSGGIRVSVPDELSELVRTALEYSALSDGKYDITIAPVMDLWDFGGENQSLPDHARMSDALSRLNRHGIVTGDGYITLPVGVELDLGSIAKGFIADKIADYLRSQNVGGAIINLGGNILAIGEKNGGKPFEIGIQRPFSKSGDIFETVAVTNASVVSSGVYERYFELDGILYHHLLDATTGYPADTGLLSVTILSASSTAGDALSSVCFLLGPERGLELVESLSGVEAIFLTDSGEERVSSGLAREKSFIL